MTLPHESTTPFAGLRAAITGGTSGLGLATARALVAQGAHVAIVARSPAAVARVAAEHANLHGIVGDVAAKADTHRIAMQVLGALGRLDVLVNNASSLGPPSLALLADTECEDFEAALGANLLGPFRLTRALLGALAASARQGVRPVVVNISSDAAVQAYPTWGAYGASKAALLHLTRIWHAELTPEGITVLSFDPGDMDTPLHAAAVPDADRGSLKRPETAAGALLDVLAAALLTRGRIDSLVGATG